MPDEETPGVPCPDCKGRKTVFAFLDGRGPNGRRVSSHGEIPCFTCKGTGTVSPERVDRKAEGERRRLERMDRGVSVSEEAVRLGITPSLLSKMERGAEPFPDEVTS